MKGKTKKILRILCLLAALGVMCYAGLIALVYYWEVSVPEAVEYDGIIVLGAQVKPDGQPSLMLQWRLDKAAECYWKNFMKKQVY